ncbi:hypothetical protein ACE1TF_13805 [Geomicrobium sp. JSM 1781026]|uniref:hypothetical protein n=1 Tax=Geomicrobium sp. JSM 1781026 TaxID=3344580 RepID=UPI0035C03E9D
MQGEEPAEEEEEEIAEGPTSSEITILLESSESWQREYSEDFMSMFFAIVQNDNDEAVNIDGSLT